MNRLQRKINIIGKISKIVAIVLLVIVITASVCVSIFGVFILVQPKDLIEVDVAGSAEVSVSGKLLEKATDGTLETIVSEINDHAPVVTVNGITLNAAESADGRLVLRGGAGISSFNFKRVGGALLLIALSMGCLIYALIMLKSLMAQLAVCETPFCDGVVKSMRNFAISLIPYAVLRPTLTSLAGKLLSSDGFDIDLNVDLSVVLGVLVILLLMLVFRYGAQLQKESDETL